MWLGLSIGIYELLYFVWEGWYTGYLIFFRICGQETLWNVKSQKK